MKTDLQIQNDVMAQMKWLPMLTASETGVTVKNGVVTLLGYVDSYPKKAAASIEPLTGVKMVLNLITIKPKPLAENVKQNIQSAFTRHASIDGSKIKVDIIEDKALLTGSVRRFVESEDVAWATPGVNSIENKLEIGEEEFVNN